jgi:hypothetical protein
MADVTFREIEIDSVRSGIARRARRSSGDGVGQAGTHAAAETGTGTRCTSTGPIPAVAAAGGLPSTRQVPPDAACALEDRAKLDRVETEYPTPRSKIAKSAPRNSIRMPRPGVQVVALDEQDRSDRLVSDLPHLSPEAPAAK